MNVAIIGSRLIIVTLMSFFDFCSYNIEYICFFYIFFSVTAIIMVYSKNNLHIYYCLANIIFSCIVYLFIKIIIRNICCKKSNSIVVPIGNDLENNIYGTTFKKDEIIEPAPEPEPESVQEPVVESCSNMISSVYKT